ncbi:hypothetical protein LCGC14_2865850, partial [marine sediment metagenome]
ILVGSDYYPAPDDLFSYQPGQPYVDGDGLTKFNGFEVVVWKFGEMTYDQYWNIYISATIHNGAFSAKTTIRTRASQDDSTYANYNAISTIPVIALTAAVSSFIQDLKWTHILRLAL